jgi:hypothetical protein
MALMTDKDDRRIADTLLVQLTSIMTMLEAPAD